MERQLVAVLAADVVGYSRMMHDDEVGTFEELKERRLTLFEPKLRSYRGRLVKTMGDGLLVEFSSALDAVNCAIALQEANQAVDAPRPAGRRLVLRIGVSLSDVMRDRDDIYGTGVNIAARLQSIAEPNGVAISGAVLEQVRGKILREAKSRGPQHLKNIADPIEVYDLPTGPDPAHAAHSAPASAAGAARRAIGGALPLPDRPSIAVLPLDNLSNDPSQQYFSDGVSEDIITELSRFRSLFVIARNSSFRYRGGNVEIARVGRELGVQYVVEGSIQRSGDRLRATVQLIDVLNGFHVWADRYDYRVDDLFSIQDDVTRNIASRVTNRLEQAHIEAAKRRAPGTLRAYDLWLRGVECHDQGTDDGHAKAREFYEAAIKADPAFARPYCGLAELVFMQMVFPDWSGAPPRDGEAMELAHKAVTLDEQEAHGHAILGWAQLLLRKFGRARRHLERSAALNPNDADVGMTRALGLAFLGDAKAGVEAARQAIRLNPFHPDWYLSDLAVMLCLDGQYDEMQAIFDAIPEIYPHTPAWRAAAYALLGNLPAAHAAAERFEHNVRPIWRGRPDAPVAAFGQSFLHHLPLARDEDVAEIAKGLRAAGLLPTQ
jgi:TolB-like protein/class 3 adenylate cyclase